MIINLELKDILKRKRYRKIILKDSKNENKDIYIYNF